MTSAGIHGSRRRWLGWLAFAGTTVLFLLLQQFLMLTPLFVGCDPTFTDTEFGACDQAVTRLSCILFYGGFAAVPVAAFAERHRRWLGSALLIWVALVFSGLWACAYA